jgi:hypothetical protein
MEAISSDEVGEFIVDMDEAADLVRDKIERPKFYYTEESQQHRYECNTCKSYEDILGVYGYCSCCATSNALQVLEKQVKEIRVRLKDAAAYEECLRAAVSRFDASARWYVKQLQADIPLTRRRKGQLGRLMFHNLNRCNEIMQAIFDIDMFADCRENEKAFIHRQFCRRHIYEHNGGQVDQRYLDESGDTSVRLRQALRENQEDTFRVTELVLKLARNLHNGFHDIFPPQPMPLEIERERQARLRAK